MRPPIAMNKARWRRPTAKVQRRRDIAQEVAISTVRGADSGTVDARHQHHQFFTHQDTAADSGQEEEAAGSPKTGI